MKAKEYFDLIVTELSSDGIESGQMFGKPCLKLNKKAVAAFYTDEMVFKIGKDQVQEKLEKYSGSKNWDPSGKGRPMKDWIQVPFDYKDDWKKLTQLAIDFTV